jgi:Skp family chaperone for outer membrane proteins
MKWYSILGVLVVVCVAVAAPLSFVSAESTEGKANIQGTGESPDQSKMQVYKKELQSELRAIDKKIAALGKKVKKEGAKLKGEAKESWDDLKAKQAAAKSKLKDLAGAGKETWEKTKSEADAVLDDLKKAYDKAASYFK